MNAPAGVKHIRDVLRPQPGPQTRLLASSAQIVIYGGQAGGGKTFGLLLDPIHDAVSWDGFRGILFRKTLKAIEAQGGPWDVASRIYPRLGATSRGFPHFEWTFPSGAKLRFAQIHDDGDLDAHQGAQYTWCADVDTDVLMGDGSFKRMGDVVVGDVVATLVGPRRVTLAPPPHMKDCVTLRAAGGSITVSRDHQILLANRWAAPEGPRPIGFCGCGSTPESSPPSSPDPQPLAACSPSGRPRAVESRPPPHRGTAPQAIGACSVGARSDCAVSGGSLRGPPQPQGSCDLAVLLERALPQGESFDSNEHPQRALSCAQKTTREDQGSPCGCRGGRGSCGARLQSAAKGDQSRTPSPADADARTSEHCSSGDQGCTQSHNCLHRIEYFHPYTREHQVSREAVRLAPVSQAPAGERAVRDLRVEGAAHWIARGGWVSRNCGFDEGTHFTTRQFWYLIGRLRSPFGAPPPGTLLRCRLTCNPDPRSFVAKLIAWWVDQRTGLPIPERDGVVRYIAKDGDKLIEGASPREVREQAPHLFVDAKGNPLRWQDVCLSLTFIKSTLADNAALMEADPAYQARLRALDPVTRRQWMEGSWLVVAEGEFFQPPWFPRLTVAPQCIRTVRFWDLAGSKRRRSDFLAGVKVGQMENGNTCVLDVVNRKGSPAEHEETVKATAIADGKDCEIWVEEEKGASGQLLVNNWARGLLRGFNVNPSPNGNEDKQTRAKLPSAAANKGLILCLEREWTDEFMQQLQSFPDGDHDDMVDGLTGGWHRLHDESELAFASVSTGG